ncbi:MAG: TIGR01459 family HAD-type hydrolase [Rhodospirillaceae bacterium]|nr:TIGR01459 family HAD-type hydrolase [Rhodospirillaceae bacterium]
MTIRHLRGLREVAELYDGFILDLWGLVHDGETPYPSAKATLAALKAAGKKTLLLSNAPRRAYALVEAMTRMGIERSLYGEVLSSGEATRDALIARSDPAFARLGRRAYHMGPERDRSVFEQTGLEIVADVAAADFLVNTGPSELTHQVADYQAVLERAVARALPMVCANPDLLVIRGGRPVICAGATAARYIEMGGTVMFRGKPDPVIYKLAAQMLGVTDSRRVAVVGDALETDVKGANAVGFDSVWCTGGIHAAELGCAYGVAADPTKAEALAVRFGQTPTATIPGFIW